MSISQKLLEKLDREYFLAKLDLVEQDTKQVVKPTRKQQKQRELQRKLARQAKRFVQNQV